MFTLVSFWSGTPRYLSLGGVWKKNFEHVNFGWVMCLNGNWNSILLGVVRVLCQKNLILSTKVSSEKICTLYRWIIYSAHSGRLALKYDTCYFYVSFWPKWSISFLIGHCALRHCQSLFPILIATNNKTLNPLRLPK